MEILHGSHKVNFDWDFHWGWALYDIPLTYTLHGNWLNYIYWDKARGFTFIIAIEKKQKNLVTWQTMEKNIQWETEVCECLFLTQIMLIKVKFYPYRVQSLTANKYDSWIWVIKNKHLNKKKKTCRIRQIYQDQIISCFIESNERGFS